eukprot:673263-Pelagomonas_calceolata.AAC.1
MMTWRHRLPPTGGACCACCDAGDAGRPAGPLLNAPCPPAAAHAAQAVLMWRAGPMDGTQHMHTGTAQLGTQHMHVGTQHWLSGCASSSTMCA